MAKWGQKFLGNTQQLVLVMPKSWQSLTLEQFIEMVSLNKSCYVSFKFPQRFSTIIQKPVEKSYWLFIEGMLTSRFTYRKRLLFLIKIQSICSMLELYWKGKLFILNFSRKFFTKYLWDSLFICNAALLHVLQQLTAM